MSAAPLFSNDDVYRMVGGLLLAQRAGACARERGRRHRTDDRGGQASSGRERQGARGPIDRRPVMVHAQLAREEQLDRMQPSSVSVPSFCSSHCFYWGELSRRLGSGARAGVPHQPGAVSGAPRDAFQPAQRRADGPAEHPLPDLERRDAAVARRRGDRAGAAADAGRGPAGGHHRRRLPALRGVARKGSLEVGKLADMARAVGEPAPGSAPEAIREIDGAGDPERGQCRSTSASGRGWPTRSARDRHRRPRLADDRTADDRVDRPEITD